MGLAGNIFVRGPYRASASIQENCREEILILQKFVLVYLATLLCHKALLIAAWLQEESNIISLGK